MQKNKLFLLLKDSDEDGNVISQLKEYVDDEDDPLAELSKLLESPTKPKKQKKREIFYQRDKHGSRTYPYKGKRSTSKSSNGNKKTKIEFNKPPISVLSKEVSPSPNNQELISTDQVDSSVLGIIILIFFI